VTVYLDLDDLVQIARIVVGRDVVVRDAGLLASAATRPATHAFGVEAYPRLWAKAGALLHSVCMNHALVDGNKRLAWAAAVTFLALNGQPVPDIDVDAAEKLVMSVADGSLGDVERISAGLQRLYGR
jgi:death on curing protein